MPRNGKPVRQIPLTQTQNERRQSVPFVFISVMAVSAALTVWARSLLHTSEQDDSKKKAAITEALEKMPSSCRRAVPPIATKNEDDRKTQGYEKSLAVANFDIMGFRLYVPVQEVLANAQGYGDVLGPPQIELTECASDDIEHDRQWREVPAGEIGPLSARTSCIGGIGFVGKEMTLQIRFSEDLPTQPGCMVVVSILLDEGDIENAASFTAWDEALSRKYGASWPYPHQWGDDSAAKLTDFEGGGLASLELSDYPFEGNRANARLLIVEDAKPTLYPHL